jgi:hypothetical protein
MSSFRSASNEYKRDTILLLLIGRLLQEETNNLPNRSEDKYISNRRFMKATATILRHWETLRQSEEIYREIHKWGILHTPHRFGQIIYTRYPSKEINGESDALERVITENNTLKKFTRIMSSDTYNPTAIDESEKYICFEKVNLRQELSNNFDLLKSKDELHIAYELSRVYGGLSTTHLNALATTPTEYDCCRAMESEIQFWFKDLQSLISNCTDEIDNVWLQNRINKAIIAAYKAGWQVEQKHLLYEENLRPALDSALRNRRSDSMMTPLLEVERRIINNLKTKREAMIDAADIMTGFLGACIESLSCLEGIDIKKALTLGMLNQLNKKMDRLLEKNRDLAKDLADCLRINNGLPYEYKLQEQIQRFVKPWFMKIQEMFKEERMPFEYQSDNIFNKAHYQSYYQAN